MKLSLLAAVASLSVAACGGGTDSIPPGGCKATLSGAVSLTVDCIAMGAHNDNDGKTNFAISASDTTNGAFNFVVQTGSGDLAATTYSSGNVDKASGSFNNIGYSKIWMQYFNDSSSADQGTFSLTLTSTGNKITASGGSGWTLAHGSADVTLTPGEPGTTGNITVHVTF